MDDQYVACHFGADTVGPSSSLYPKKHHVLLVDDDEMTCNVMRRMLGQVCQVDIYTLPNQAQKAFVRGKYQVAFIDLGMTQMRGDVLEKFVREKDPDIVTVLVTGWHIEKHDARASGFDFCIYKPIEMSELLDLLHDALALYKRRRS